MNIIKLFSYIKYAYLIGRMVSYINR